MFAPFTLRYRLPQCAPPNPARIEVDQQLGHPARIGRVEIVGVASDDLEIADESTLRGPVTVENSARHRLHLGAAWIADDSLEAGVVEVGDERVLAGVERRDGEKEPGRAHHEPAARVFAVGHGSEVHGESEEVAAARRVRRDVDVPRDRLVPEVADFRIESRLRREGQQVAPAQLESRCMCAGCRDTRHARRQRDRRARPRAPSRSFRPARTPCVKPCAQRLKRRCPAEFGSSE